MSQIKVIGARWDKDRVALKDIRKQVFIQEQGVLKTLNGTKLITTVNILSHSSITNPLAVLA